MTLYCPITVARFWSKVDVSGARSCWLWRGAVRGGYGNVKIDGTSYSSNRVAYEVGKNDPLNDRMALHKCDNKLCCNPAHIYAGSASDNMKDSHSRGRRFANKLTPQEVVEIRHWGDLGHKHSWLARRFGVSKAQISRIVSRQAWAYVSEQNWNPTPRQENHT